MYITSKRLTDDEPIVLFTFNGLLNQEVFQEVLELNAKYIAEIGEPIYIIADVRLMQTLFFEMLNIIQEAEQVRPGSIFDTNIRMLIFVGNPPILKLFRERTTESGAVFPMPIFDNMEEAVTAARHAYAATK